MGLCRGRNAATSGAASRTTCRATSRASRAGEPQVTFGPVTGIVRYPADISALKQDAARWEITYTIDSIPPEGARFGLASRDESGQTEPGHLTVWINDQGKVWLRHQDIEGGHASVELISNIGSIVGREYKAVVSFDPATGIGLFVDGVLNDHDPWAAGLGGNDLGFVLGGSCSVCRSPDDPRGSRGPKDEIDGTVYMEIFDAPLALPEPITLRLTWTNPVQFTDGTPIPPGVIQTIRIYHISPDVRHFIAEIPGGNTSYVATHLVVESLNCFVVTAVAGGESMDSEPGCASPAAR